MLAYAKITVDGEEYIVYSDAIARSIVSVIRSNLSAPQYTDAAESALDTVNKSENTNYTYNEFMTMKVGKDTGKQAFVKAVFTQFCKDKGYIQ